ncbi:MAG: sodium:solute symporter family protein [Planctomycetaceae bacterium]|nr:sodium:solute symporter family protein [Planctomycetaceae bacterium]
MQLGVIDYVIMLIYVGAVLGIGWVLRVYMKTSSDFLTSGRSIPAWVTGLAFISANLGALELVGMAASGAKYGIATAHFYWVGAIPAMVFLAIFMMPFYYGSKARSVPEYLNMRFDYRTRCLNSISFAVMTLFSSGISMNALAKLLHQLLGWDYNASLWICSGVVLIYVLKGGLTSAIYTEVLQFFMIVLGFTPVVYLGLKDVGGWEAVKTQLTQVAADPAALDLNTKSFGPDAWTSAWKPLLGGPESNPMGVDLFAMVFGLGFVLSFGYWCTNFLVVQRAMAAKDMGAARRTPLIAAIPKMFFPVLVILPGMLAVALASMGKDNYRLPPRIIDTSDYAPVIAVVQSADAANVDAAFNEIADIVGYKMSKEKVASIIQDNAAGSLSQQQLKDRIQDAVVENDYDGIILSLVKKYCPTGLLGLALTALLASFMSGMAGNVTAFNTIWTYDLYQAYLVRQKSDAHYLWMGKVVTVAGILLSIACAYFAKQYNNAMDIIQLVFGFVNAPTFATFALGMLWAGTTGTGAFVGLLLGITTSAVFHSLTLAAGNVPGLKGGYIAVVKTFPSEMAQNFWLAAYAFLVCFILTIVISLVTKRTKTNEELKGLVYSLTPKVVDHEQNWLLRPAVLGVILLIGCVILNWLFW